MAARSYRELVVWKKAMDLVTGVYHATTRIPADERYGLTSQMRRAAVSIPSNIAEGQARATNDFVRFLTIARGSLFELEMQIQISQRLDYLKDEAEDELLTATDEVSQLISGLSKSLSRRD